jgi:hypothetical protein
MMPVLAGDMEGWLTNSGKYESTSQLSANGREDYKKLANSKLKQQMYWM